MNCITEYVKTLPNDPLNSEQDLIEIVGKERFIAYTKEILPELESYESACFDSKSDVKTGPVLFIYCTILFIKNACMNFLGGWVIIGVIWLISYLFNGFHQLLDNHWDAFRIIIFGLILYLTLDVAIFTPIRENRANKRIKNKADELLNSKRYYEFLKENIPILKPKYISSDAVRAFQDYFVNDRCTTMRDARNLYEQQLSSQKIQSQLNGIQQRAQLAAEYARDAYRKADEASMR